MRKTLLALLLVALALPVGAQTPLQAAPPVQSAATLRTQTFETVWRIVNEKFYDPTFNGVDWRGVRERYAPRVHAVKSDEELYTVLNEMLGELKVSHFGVMPPQSAVDASTDPDDASWGGTVGMTVRVVDGLATITEVEPDGGAAEAGLRPGFVLTRIGGRDVEEIQRRAAASGASPVMQRFTVRRAISALLGGMHGTTVDVGFIDAANARRTASVARYEVTGKPMRFGQLPTFVTRVSTRRLPGNVGYLTFNVFLPPLMDDIREALQSLRGASAIIVDLRGNPGGVGGMAPAVAALFLAESISLGTMKMRTGEIRFVTYRQSSPYTGPLVMLTDEATASTSEILAGALQEAGRATVVGEPSLGAVLPSLVETLPNGAIFQYAVADFKTPKGVLLEGRGVSPNVAVAPSRSDYLAGRDPVLEAALAHIAANHASGPAAKWSRR